MKPIPAFLAALAVSIAIGLTMLAIGGNAFFNTNTVQAANSPAQAAAISNVSTTNTTAGSSTSTDQQVAQLQSLVQQYQQREQQYQDELNQAAQTIKNDESQLASLQQVIQALIDRGILSVDANGNLTLRRGNR